MNITDIEKKVLEVCAQVGMGIKSNKNEHTILKRIPPSRYSKKDVKHAIKNLISKGYLTLYRKENYCFTKDGMKLARRLWKQKRQNKYKGMRLE
jgi:hypothetical protein